MSVITVGPIAGLERRDINFRDGWAYNFHPNKAGRLSLITLFALVFTSPLLSISESRDLN